MRNILSIDGGGVKTYMPLRLLNEIEHRTRIPISDLFDYFAGVSAGALVCSMLLIKNKQGKQKYSTDKLIEIFETQCREIFECSLISWVSTGFGLLNSTYKSANMEKNLDNYFKKILLDELIKPISIITFDISANKPIYFNRITFPKTKIKACLMATTAAPTYFAPYKMTINKNKCMLIDGGVVNSNPVEQCFLDAHNYYNVFKKTEIQECFYTLSLGCGYYETKYSLKTFGIISWSTKIIDIMLNANMCEDNYQLKLIDNLISGNKLKRIDFKLKNKINLDNINSFDTMKTLMDEWIKENNSMIDKLCEDLIYNYRKNN
jgi:hypothetical protein